MYRSHEATNRLGGLGEDVFTKARGEWTQGNLKHMAGFLWGKESKGRRRRRQVMKRTRDKERGQLM
jgi:hypothetical protein